MSLQKMLKKKIPFPIKQLTHLPPQESQSFCDCKGSEEIKIVSQATQKWHQNKLSSTTGHLKFSQCHLTAENWDYVSVEVIPSWSKREGWRRGLSLNRRGVVGRRAGPANIPFQSDGERDHPSVGLLRIFMTGWCHSGYSLAGLRHRNPRRSETLMTRRVSWLEGTTETKRQDETDAGMQIASWWWEWDRCVPRA